MKRSRPVLLLTFALFAGALPDAGAVVRRHDVPDSQYLRLGKRMAFASVGRVEIDYGDADGFIPIGTATLIGRDRLVSAGHVFDSDALFGAQGVRINFGHGRIQRINFQAEGVVNVNPGFNRQTLSNDVSVVFLPRKFRLTPGKLYSGRQLALEKPITFVGFGDTGTGLTGSSRVSQRKRGGENALGRYVSAGKRFEVDFDHPTNLKFNSLGGSSALALEGLLGPGDSGGSAWVKVGKKWKLVGINSYGVDWFPNGNGNTVEDDYGDRSGFVYLPKYEAWINSLDNPSLTGASARKAMTLSAVPEAGTVGLMALGLGVLAIARRNQPA